MWTTKAAVFELPVPSGAVKKDISELRQGEVFSINAKAKKFAFNRFSSVKEGDGKTMTVIAHNLTGTETVGASIVLPCPSQVRQEVLSWGLLPNFTAKDHGQTFDLFERVEVGGSKILGTVIDIDSQQFPSRDVNVLYDQIVEGNWTGKYPVYDVKSLGVRASEEIVAKAKKAQSVIRELRDGHDRKVLASFHKKAKEEMNVIAHQQFEDKNRKVYQKNLEQAHKAEASKIAQQVLSINAAQFKSVVDTGIITITAGEFNYETDKALEILGTYWDSVRQYVKPFSDSEKICTLATQAVLEQLGSLISDGYFLIRLGYIQKLAKGGYGVFSHNGKQQGRHPTKHKAVAQLRQAEIMKKQGMATEFDKATS